MNLEAWFKSSLENISLKSAESVIKLAAEGATVPFMARYRKEMTGNLDEVQIQQVLDAKENWEQITKRQEYICSEILKQEKLTDALKNKIMSTFVLAQLEDIYLPFKLKRKTKAVIAREAGLEPLANWIWEQGSTGGSVSPETEAVKFIDKTKKIPDVETALKGACDIIIEKLSENVENRQYIRDQFFKNSYVHSKKGTKAQTPSKFDKYFEFSEGVTTLQKKENTHRYLAMRRGWLEEELSLSISGAPGQEEAFEAQLIKRLEEECGAHKNSACAETLKKCAKMAFKVYISPSITNELHKHLKDIADSEAIQVFSNNVSQVLLSPPLGSKCVLGVDPGIRTGCKLAIVDQSGKMLHHGVFHLQTGPQQEQAKAALPSLLDHFKIEAIAVGNGTAGRETEVFFRSALKGSPHSKIPVILVNESGASIYSASEVARKEFPDLDLTVRGAISIARRLQDPLAELVKIDPKSIGVGQYQHDVSQPALKKALESVVDTCVNKVGVDLNTASEYLLARVSGIGPTLAKNILKHRESNGLFKNKKTLLKVARFSDKVFEQAAGFLRVMDSDHPLDKTGVHPERYEDLELHAKQSGIKISDLLGKEGAKILSKAKELKAKWGDFTFNDVLQELEKPGRDPRDAFEAMSFRDDISEIKDLELGMICPGIVTNVTNFGAFVDIGVHQDGLVHISQMSHNFVKDPREVVETGQTVKVRVIEVNQAKKQIALSMRLEEQTSSASNSRLQGSPQTQKRGQSSGGGKAAPREDFKNNPFAKLGQLKR
ncbi:RNA-binding transcriptional accessory protein [bacterium]|nr:RNA-binding transcriptional accessory protein [bacterium]